MKQHSEEENATNLSFARHSNVIRVGNSPEGLQFLSRLIVRVCKRIIKRLRLPTIDLHSSSIHTHVSVLLHTQDSLANAKVNVRQHSHVRWTLSCLTPHFSRTPANICITLISLETTFTGLHFRRWQYGSICIRLAVVASQTRNHAKFRENSTLQQFKVIQGHRSWCESKAHVSH